MITGTYLLQTNKHKFSKATVCAKCKCCWLGDEDITHMLLDCAALYSQRKLYYPKVRTLTIQYLGMNMWREIIHTKLNIVRLLLDCTTFPMFKSEKHIMEITKASTELCYRLHLKRMHKLKGEWYEWFLVISDTSTAVYIYVNSGSIVTLDTPYNPWYVKTSGSKYMCSRRFNY